MAVDYGLDSGAGLRSDLGVPVDHLRHRGDRDAGKLGDPRDGNRFARQGFSFFGSGCPAPTGVRSILCAVRKFHNDASLIFAS